MITQKWDSYIIGSVAVLKGSLAGSNKVKHIFTIQ